MVTRLGAGQCADDRIWPPARIAEINHEAVRSVSTIAKRVQAEVGDDVVVKILRVRDSDRILTCTCPQSARGQSQ